MLDENVDFRPKLHLIEFLLPLCFLLRILYSIDSELFGGDYLAAELLNQLLHLQNLLV